MPPENDLQKAADEQLASEISKPTPPPPPRDPNSPLKQIRTFQGDVAEALGTQKESIFSIQQQEVERLRQIQLGQAQQIPSFSPPQPPPIPRATGHIVSQPTVEKPGKARELIMLTFGSLVLIVLGLVGAWYGYQSFLEQTAAPIVIVPDNRFIATQSSADLDITDLSREMLLVKIEENLSGVGETELKHLVLKNGSTSLATLVSAPEFFQALKVTAPGSLLRSFDPLFMIGLLAESRFIILKLASFENAFPGMLSWEKTLATDLAPIFGTAHLLKNIAPESVFKDVVSKNKDARVLYAPVAPASTSTTPVLLYSFFDNQMLIITDNMETLKTLIDRLTQKLLIK